MNIEKALKRDLSKIDTPAMDSILGNNATVSRQTRQRPPRRPGLLITIILLLCCLAIAVAAVAPTVIPMIIRQLNADAVMENPHQLTEVPEGYIGIYTKEELVSLSKTAGTEKQSYILMNDITFTDEDYAKGGLCEGGFTPIGKYAVSHTFAPALDTFNGNGYVIRNLKINVQNEEEVGFLRSANTVLYLGLEDCEISIRYDAEIAALPHESYYTYWGAIVGNAKFVGACYVDGLTVRIEFDPNNASATISAEFLVGGLGGSVENVDSCYVNNATLTVTGTGYESAALRVGGVAGTVSSCVTSYFVGTVKTDVRGFTEVLTEEVAVTTLAEYVPILMNEETWNELSSMVETTDRFSYNKFRATYIRFDPEAEPNDVIRETLLAYLEQMDQLNGGVIDLDTQKAWYVFSAPGAGYDDRATIARILLDTFEGDEEALIDFCRLRKAKCGSMYCYTPKKNEMLTAEAWEGFDFENIWAMQNGRPVPQIFAYRASK